MLKSLHLLLIVLSLAGFVGRVLLSAFKPEAMQHPLSRIAPHIINTLLILSGIGLVLVDDWISKDFNWIISKFMLLLAYIGLGVMSIHNTGIKRWLFFTGALACFAYIFVIAITKQGFI